MSFSIAFGRTRSSTKARTVSWVSRCSSVSSRSTPQVYGSLLLVPALVAGLAFDGGGYSATTWGWSTLLPLAAIGALLVSGRARRLTRLESVFLALVAALVAWTWLSLVWSADFSASVLDGERALLYVAAAAMVLLVGRPVPLVTGLLAAISLACAYGLALRIFGHAGYDVGSAAPDAAHRLAEPLGYSNALGAFAAMGIVLSVGLARRHPFAALALPVLVPTLYLTYSRGAWIALGAGLLAAASLRARRRALVAAAGVAVALVATAAALYGGRAYRAFSSAGPTTAKTHESARLLSLSGSSRSQYWHVAWDEYRSKPWLGTGAGGFQRSWLARRPSPLPVLDAHSLELETLTELGPFGLVLLLAALATPVAAAVAHRRSPLAPAAFGAYAVFLVHSAQDWDWEVPAVTVAALVCAAALLAAARGEAPPATLGRVPRGVGVAGCAALAAVAVLAFGGNHALETARHALDEAQPRRAADAAHDARGWAPWSPEGWRLLGEAQLEQGRVAAARASFRRGLAKDDRDWELWLDLALAETGAARRNALEHASALNPLDPQVQRLRAAA